MPAEPGLSEALIQGLAWAEAVLPTKFPNLSLLPSGRDLVGAEIELVDRTGREARLKQAIEPLRENFEFLFIDSAHSAEFADWYLGNLFPLIRRSGVIHVHDVEAPPEVIAEGHTFYSEKPSGEEERLAAYLLARRDQYRWFSVAALVRDPAYLAAVRPHGGGTALPSGGRRAHPREQRIGHERNPSLWIERVATQEQTRYPGLPFAPIVRSPLGRLRYAVRKRIAPAYAPIREARRDRKLKRRHR